MCMYTISDNNVFNAILVVGASHYSQTRRELGIGLLRREDREEPVKPKHTSREGMLANRTQRRGVELKVE